MKMIVNWGPEDSADYQVPAEVKWEDGTPATLADYYKIQTSTHSSHPTDKGLVTVISPGHHRHDALRP